MDEKELLKKAFEYGNVPRQHHLLFHRTMSDEKQMYPLSIRSLQKRED